MSKNVRTQDVRTQEFFKQGGSFYTRKVAKVWKGMGKSKKFRKQTKFDKLFGLSLYYGVYFQLNEERVGKSIKERKWTPPKIWQTIWVKPLLWCLFVKLSKQAFTEILTTTICHINKHILCENADLVTCRPCDIGLNKYLSVLNRVNKYKTT